MKNFSYIHIEKLKVWGRGNVALKQYKQNKYKRYWGVQGCWEHDMRLIDTANADPQRLHQNAIACEETGWKLHATKSPTLETLKAQDPEFIAKKAKSFLDSKQIKPREDQVKVAMLLCAASPEFLRDGSASNQLNHKKTLIWAKSTVAFLKKKYPETLLACVVHMDELNPHLTAYLVPALEVTRKPRRNKSNKNNKAQPENQIENQIESTRWSLNAAVLFTPDPKIFETDETGKKKKIRTGKGTCSLLQDEYAEALQESGLDLRRGIRRAPFQTGLEHETTKKRWEDLSSHIPEIDAIPDNALREWAKIMALQAANARRFLLEKNHYQVAAQAAIDRLKRAVGLAKKLKKEKNSLKNVVKKRNKLPSIEETLKTLTGIQPTLTPHGSIIILPTGQKLLLGKNNKFQNLTPEIKGLGSMTNKTHGNGPLEAIIYVTGWKMQESMEWIADTFSLEEAAATWSNTLSDQSPTPERLQNQNHLKNFTQALTQHEDSLWGTVIQKLTSDFGFDLDLITRLRNNRWIGTNKYGHLTVSKIQYNELQNPVPAGKIIRELKTQTNEGTLFKHETGVDGVSIIADPQAKKTIISSDPIEALALRHLHPESAILIVGQNPGKNTENILSLTQKTSELEIAEPSNPPQSLKDWIQKQVRKGLNLIPIPLGFQSFSEYFSAPKELSAPAFKVLEFEPPSQIKQWERPNEKAE